MNPRIIKESFALIEARAEEVTPYFYGRLFAENPRLRALFPPAMDIQRDRFLHALREIVWSLDSPDTLAAFLSRLGRAHRKYGVRREHFDAMGGVLLTTLRKFAGDDWTAEMENAWRSAYTTAADMMTAAAEECADQPAWWTAEVIGHELRRPDIAVLTLRTDEPLPYRAGQYTTLQSSRWPWAWRAFSIANAPRPDGLLRIHVRAVPAGWISGALVRHTKIGDTVLLGEASGTMALDADAGRDILCVAGGTGLAPMKALVEEAVRAPGRPVIHLLVGARRRSDLYDLADLESLSARYPWLRVIPVVSDDPAFDGMHGEVPGVLDRFHDWSGHDVYVAGPAQMVESAVTNLQRLGVSPVRIHHDPLDWRAQAVSDTV